MASGSKFLVLLIPLIIFGGIGFYALLPHHIGSKPAPDVRAMEQDLNAMRQIAALMVRSSGDVAPDGRVDAYGALQLVVADEKLQIKLCHSARSGKGPTIEEIRAGDYTNFPYQRARGKFRATGAEKPVLWDRAPTEMGPRLIVFNNGTAKGVPEADFEKLLTSYGIK